MIGKVKGRIKSLTGRAAEHPVAVQELPELEGTVQEAVRAFESGQLPRCEELCKLVVAQNPHEGRALNLLGVISFISGRKEEGVAYLTTAVEKNPDFAPAHSNLGNAMRDLGELDKAVHCYRRALALRPAFFDALSNLGQTLSAQGRMEEAEESFRKALALRPDFPDGHYNLGLALSSQGKADEAASSYRQALALNPGHLRSSLNLGNYLVQRGGALEAASIYRRTLETTPHPALHSNLLLCLNYFPRITGEELYAEHLRWDAQYGGAGRMRQGHANERAPERVLRVGYVSPDLGLHPVGFFLAGVLAAHDRDKVRVYAYSGRKEEDDYTVTLRKNCDVWRQTFGMEDEPLEELIVSDGIDILIDLSGHTRSNRLPVFARKPAPVQATWAGYVGTTGLEAIDYLISDARETPDGAERFCREEIVRLPDGYVCYAPPRYAEPVAPLPAAANGFVTFGSFNNPAKINPEVVALWGALLRALPEARLLLKYQGYGEPDTGLRYRELFAAQGIDSSRLILEDGCPPQQFLASYHRVDIALDPFPYSGGLTTLEALWMGVPVVTLGGERFCSRHSVSHLTNAGVPELIAEDADGYLATCVELAGDLERLAGLRAALRDKVADSPVCDAVAFTRHLEDAYRGMWRAWCVRGASAT